MSKKILHLKVNNWHIILTCILVLSLLYLPAKSSQASLFEFSIKDEAELGKKFDVLIRTKFPLVEDPVVVNYVSGLVQEILEVMPPQPFPIKVSIIRDNSMNAFAAPAGYIFVNTGLILNLEHESELVAILAHELVHVSQRHIAKNIERSQYLQIGTLLGMLAGALLGGESPEAGRALIVGSQAAGQAAKLKYTREDEREADQMGIEYMTNVGYSPQGMASSFERILNRYFMSQSDSMPSYLQTHPGLQERIGYVQDMAEKISKKKNFKEHSNEQFYQIQTLIRARYTDPNTTINYYRQREGNLSCLDLLGQGITLQRLHNVAQAEEILQKANQCGNSALIHRETGRFYFQMGEFGMAEKHLQKALDDSPDDYMALFYYAMVQVKTGRAEAGIENLREVLRYIPDDAQVHSFLGRALGEHGNQFEGYLHFAYSALYENKKEKTDYYLQKAENRAQTPEQRQKIREFKDKLAQRSKYW